MHVLPSREQLYKRAREIFSCGQKLHDIRGRAEHVGIICGPESGLNGGKIGAIICWYILW
jgi:hypothetical protein